MGALPWRRVSIAAGAFGAHGAGSEEAAEWLRTGGLYGLIHGAVPWRSVEWGRRSWRRCCWLGAAVFAGTLWLMAFGAPRWLGAVTPVGGALMIAGLGVVRVDGVAGRGAAGVRVRAVGLGLPVQLRCTEPSTHSVRPEPVEGPLFFGT